METNKENQESFQPAPIQKPIPGIVIFAAILNFFSAAFFMLIIFLCAIVFIFGQAFHWYQFLLDKITMQYPAFNFQFGLSAVLLFFTLTSLAFLLFFIVTGVGLLRGSKFAWYFEVVLSILGLLSFPIGTISGLLILIYFFRPTVRGFFRI